MAHYNYDQTNRLQDFVDRLAFQIKEDFRKRDVSILSKKRLSPYQALDHSDTDNSHIQPLSEVYKSCAPRNFMHIEFYVSQKST